MSNITLPDLQSLEEGVFILFPLKILMFMHFILFRPGFRRRDTASPAIASLFLLIYVPAPI
jgi:hypothetical protein